MRKPSHWNTLCHRLHRLRAKAGLWFMEFMLRGHEWTERNIVAPEPVARPKALRADSPIHGAIPMPWAPGCGPIMADGEQVEIWIASTSPEAALDAYLAHIGIRWVEGAVQ